MLHLVSMVDYIYIWWVNKSRLCLTELGCGQMETMVVLMCVLRHGDLSRYCVRKKRKVGWDHCLDTRRKEIRHFHNIY